MLNDSSKKSAQNLGLDRAEAITVRYLLSVRCFNRKFRLDSQICNLGDQNTLVRETGSYWHQFTKNPEKYICILGRIR